MDTFIHESAEISNLASIGRRTRIWQNCIIQDRVRIGDDCNIGAGVYVEEDVVIGSRVKIKNNIAIYKGVSIEDDVFLGPNCVFTNVINPRSYIERKNELRKTTIKKGASIGANATILCGNTIGAYAMVGAGSVVTKDVRPYTIVIGNPARKQGYVCFCGCKLNEKMSCEACGRKYKMSGDQITEDVN